MSAEHRPEVSLLKATIFSVVAGEAGFVKWEGI